MSVKDVINSKWKESLKICRSIVTSSIAERINAEWEHELMLTLTPALLMFLMPHPLVEDPGSSGRRSFNKFP